MIQIDSQICNPRKNKDKTRSLKWRLNAFTKSIDSCKLASSAQADMGRDFLVSVNYVRVKVPLIKFKHILFNIMT